jgi:hypothetical protein
MKFQRYRTLNICGEDCLGYCTRAVDFYGEYCNLCSLNDTLLVPNILVVTVTGSEARMYGGQIEVLVHWSAVRCPADYQNTVIADQRSGKNSRPALADLPKWSFCYSAVLIFWRIFKNISKRRNYQIVGVDTDTAE